MTVRAEIVLDSVSPDNVRLTTILFRHPRMTHADFMTHRVFGRNARSSRAVPTPVLLKEPTLLPMIWGSNQSGMQAGTELTGWRRALARTTWLSMAAMTRVGVRLLHFAGLHKQWANRPLEWFGHIDVQVTSTDWRNFLALRKHPAAQPEIQELAQQIADLLRFNEPTPLDYGEWHLPWIKPEEHEKYDLETLKMLSVARSARLTYKPFDGSDSLEAEKARYDRLVGSSPVHASPAEHQATPDRIIIEERRRPTWPVPDKVKVWSSPEFHGNLRGWIQLRKTIDNEAIKEWDPTR